MEDECTEDNKHTGDELEINNHSSDITNTESTYMESDSINYKLDWDLIQSWGLIANIRA